MKFMKWKKISAFVLATSLAGSMGSFCVYAEESTEAATVTENESTESQEMKLVTDGAGNEIEVPENIERYAVSGGPYCIVAWCLDGGSSERLVAMQQGNYMQQNEDFFAKHDPHFAEVAENQGVNADCSLNIEELMNLDPDVVFLWDTQTVEAEQLKEIGIVPVMINSGAQTFEDISSQITMMGNVLGCEEQAAKLVSKFTETEEYFASREEDVANVDKTSFLYLQTSGLSVATSQTSYTDFMNKCGGVNVTADTEGGADLGYWSTVDMEQILVWDPDVIILSNFDTFTPDDLYENKIEGQDWSNISAVKNHRVYKEGVDTTFFCISYVEAPMYLEWLAKLVQPELFADIDLSEEWKDYYREMYNIELTDEEINSIMNVDLNGDIALQ